MCRRNRSRSDMVRTGSECCPFAGRSKDFSSSHPHRLDNNCSSLHVLLYAMWPFSSLSLPRFTLLLSGVQYIVIHLRCTVPSNLPVVVQSHGHQHGLRPVKPRSGPRSVFDNYDVGSDCRFEYYRCTASSHTREEEHYRLGWLLHATFNGILPL